MMWTCSPVRHITPVKIDNGDCSRSPQREDPDRPRIVILKVDRAAAGRLCGMDTRSKARSESFASCLYEMSSSRPSLGHVVGPRMHLISARLVSRIPSPECEGIWLPNLPRFVERCHNSIRQRVRLFDAFQVLRKLC